MRRYTRLRSISRKRQQRLATSARVRQQIMERANGQCEVRLSSLPVVGWIAATVRCRHRASDVHHVLKRSQGGLGNPGNLIALCRACHDRTDWPYKRGRLVITPAGAQRFTCAIRFASDKFAARRFPS